MGIAVASFITVYGPLQKFIGQYLTGILGYGAVLFLGLLTYVCSTASVPVADAFIKSGMSSGQALTYLIVGPVTSYATMLVIKKDFGGRILFLYLAVIAVGSVISGLILDASIAR